MFLFQEKGIVFSLPNLELHSARNISPSQDLLSFYLHYILIPGPEGGDSNIDDDDDGSDSVYP